MFCTEQIKKKAGTSQKVPKKGILKLHCTRLKFLRSLLNTRKPIFEFSHNYTKLSHSVVIFVLFHSEG